MDDSGYKKKTSGDESMKVIQTVITAFIAVVCMTYLFVNAVCQESFRLAPPTAEEIAENPELANYLP